MFYFARESASGAAKKERPPEEKCHSASWYSILAGLAGGILCVVVVYPVSADARIGGFPLPAYAFERLKSGAWADFVGGMTFPILVIDFVIGCWAGGKSATWLQNRLSASSDRSVRS